MFRFIIVSFLYSKTPMPALQALKFFLDVSQPKYLQPAFPYILSSPRLFNILSLLQTMSTSTGKKEQVTDLITNNFHRGKPWPTRHCICGIHVLGKCPLSFYLGLSRAQNALLKYSLKLFLWSSTHSFPYKSLPCCLGLSLQDLT
ncbi:hypothetical protein GYMLUDRAFT_913558 [Collybiopsis luxurians FD-317 M1]|nr:hypothetical protein GYMLUDRAFT_913558 [Collybiopsis luxurians FD-317 M1]